MADRMIRKNFSLEGIPGYFAGYTDGSFWNGFENPWFDEATTIRILRALVDSSDEFFRYDWQYHSEDHSFTLRGYEGHLLNNEEKFIPDSFPEGSLYAWGFGWCWMEHDPDYSYR